MTAGHAFAAPSSAARWVQCPAAPTLEARAPDNVSEQAAEGTAAHWVLEQRLAGRDPGVTAPNGVAVTDEMRDGADTVLDMITRLPPAVYGSEEQWIPGTGIDDQGGGTVDLWRYFDDHTLLVMDYKFGFRPVSAYGNWQLLYYAAALVNTYGLQPVHITLRVYQPRNYGDPWSEWTISFDDLMDYALHLQYAVRCVNHTDPDAIVGPECRDCKGRHLCPALQRAAYRIADTAKASGVTDPTLSQLGAEYRILTAAQEALTARLTGVTAQIEAAIVAGKSVPGVRADRTKPGRKWSLDDDTVLAVLGDQYAKPRQPLTPTQAEKAKADAELVASISHRPQGSLKIVPDDGTAAREAFGKDSK